MSSPSGTGPERYRPFVSRRGRQVALVIGVVQLVLLTAVGLTLPPPFGPLEQGEMIVFGLLVMGVLWRLASVRATPSELGVVVRNLVYTTRLEWAQIVAVRFGGGNPWVSLDLDDGESLAVMAIQRADGEFGLAEARRLATLLEQHSRTARDD